MNKVKVSELVQGKFYFFIHEYQTYNPVGIVKHRCSGYFLQFYHYSSFSLAIFQQKDCVLKNSYMIDQITVFNPACIPKLMLEQVFRQKIYPYFLEVHQLDNLLDI
jgi:hypothetical protein